MKATADVGTKSCERRGSTFAVTRADRRFCSERCRKVAEILRANHRKLASDKPKIPSIDALRPDFHEIRVKIPVDRAQPITIVLVLEAHGQSRE